jgi:hypothetical protein
MLVPVRWLVAFVTAIMNLFGGSGPEATPRPEPAPAVRSLPAAPVTFGVSQGTRVIRLNAGQRLIGPGVARGKGVWFAPAPVQRGT